MIRLSSLLLLPLTCLLAPVAHAQTSPPSTNQGMVVPASVFPKGTNFDFRASVSNFDMDYMWGQSTPDQLDPSVTTLCNADSSTVYDPATHSTCEDGLHRTGGWSEYAIYDSNNPHWIGVAVYASTYATSDDALAAMNDFTTTMQEYGGFMQ